MNKLFSFLAGAICGALVGGVTALLLTPAAGNDLRDGANQRLEFAKQEFHRAKAAKEQELNNQFEQMKANG